MKVAQPVAPVRATVCATAPGPDAKRCTAQPRSLGTVIRVPEKLPDSVRKLNALNAPTVRAILAILRLPSNENKRLNTARLARHFREFGAVTLGTPPPTTLWCRSLLYSRGLILKKLVRLKISTRGATVS